MTDRKANFDRRRLIINVVGYLIVLVLYVRGPPMSGFMGQAVWAYIWVYPIYYVGMMIYRRGRDRSDGS